jgi:hypothetical protein
MCVCVCTVSEGGRKGVWRERQGKRSGVGLSSSGDKEASGVPPF